MPREDRSRARGARHLSVLAYYGTGPSHTPSGERDGMIFSGSLQNPVSQPLLAPTLASCVECPLTKVELAVDSVFGERIYTTRRTACGLRKSRPPPPSAAMVRSTKHQPSENTDQSSIRAARFANRSPRAYAASALSLMPWASAASHTSRG